MRGSIDMPILSPNHSALPPPSPDYAGGCAVFDNKEKHEWQEVCRCFVAAQPFQRLSVECGWLYLV